MHFKSIIIFAALAIITNNAIASNLTAPREQIIERYVSDLQKADYKDITQLFDKNGFVISTSRGRVNAKDFFYSFLPEIIESQTQLNQIFKNTNENDRMSARFHFSFAMKDGEKGDGEYVDEFVFTPNTNTLAAVYMFENLKFTNQQ